MIQDVVSYNAHAINDGTNYRAWFDNDSFFRQADSRIVEGKRTNRSPVMLGKEPLAKTFYLKIDTLGTLATQYDQLNGWFDTRDTDEHPLIIKDLSDSNRQWYVNCTATRHTAMSAKDGVIYQMTALDPIWRTVAENSDVWDIVATGSTKDFTLRGNHYSYPVFSITPTSPKMTGLQYRITRAWLNPNAVGQSKRLQDIVGSWNTAVSNQINNGAGYSDSAMSLAIDTAVGGGLSTGAGVCYVVRTGELIFYSAIAAGVMTVTTRGYGNTTAAALLDNDVLCAYGWNTYAQIHDTTISNQINNGAGYSDSATSLAIDTPVGDGLPSGGGMCLNQRTGEQMQYLGIAAGVMTVGTRGYGGTSAAAINDNDVLVLSHLAADGRDVRAYVDGVSVPRWLRNVNTAYTSVFVNMDWDPGLSLPIKTDIAATGDVTSIDFRIQELNIINAIAEKGSPVYLVIGSEIFSATVISASNLNATGIERAVLGSSMDAHVEDDICYWMQHRVEVGYGNYLLDDPNQDETSAPLQDLDNCTNFGWKWLLFYDKAGLRSGLWFPDILKGNFSDIYYGSHGADADPATELGLSGYSGDRNGRPSGDTYEMIALFYDMAGFTYVAANGGRYRAFADWSKKSGLQCSRDGRIWKEINTISSPASAATWDTWSLAKTSLGGTYPSVQLIHKGNIKSTVDNVHHLEMQDYTGWLNAAYIPQLVFASAEISNGYELDLTITNTDLESGAGLFIDVEGLIDVGETLVIDTYAKTAIYLKDNSNAYRMLKIAVRGEWLPFDPTVVSDNVNTLRVDEPGLTGLRLATAWRDRRK